MLTTKNYSITISALVVNVIQKSSETNLYKNLGNIF